MKASAYESKRVLEDWETKRINMKLTLELRASFRKEK